MAANTASALPDPNDDPGLILIPDFLHAQESERAYRRLLAEQPWPSGVYTFGGRRFTLPRQQTWHADQGIVYSYSNNLLQTRPWTPLLNFLRQKVETALNAPFNAVLVNLYRDGEDFVGWHADDEREMGQNPLIASLSLGAERLFAYRHKQIAIDGAIALPHGSLVVMPPSFQHQWYHSVPADPSVRQSRINLTFRYVLPPGAK